MPLTKRSALTRDLTAAEADGNVDELAARAQAALDAVASAKVERVPQFEVIAGQTRPVTLAADQGAEIVLSGTGATISFSATAQGPGFAFVVRNRTGADWTVPAFAGAAREYNRAAAHTKVVSGGDASFVTYNRNGALYVAIQGDTA